MCQFNIMVEKTKKVIPCVTAWDIFNVVSDITKDFFEANDAWKQAGHLEIGTFLVGSNFTIKRIA